MHERSERKHGFRRVAGSFIFAKRAIATTTQMFHHGQRTSSRCITLRVYACTGLPCYKQQKVCMGRKMARHENYTPGSPKVKGNCFSPWILGILFAKDRHRSGKECSKAARWAENFECGNTTSNFWFATPLPLKNKTEMPSRTESIHMSMINGPIVATLTAFTLPFCSSLLGVPQSLRQP